MYDYGVFLFAFLFSLQCCALGLSYRGHYRVVPRRRGDVTDVSIEELCLFFHSSFKSQNFLDVH